MSALAVEQTAPLWHGHDIVRTPGRNLLHVVLPGVVLPTTAVFAVPLECTPDAAEAPGVRPYTGPVDDARLCPSCLRALRGEPEPEPEPAPRPIRVAAVDTLPDPEPEPDPRGRHLRLVPAQVRYTPPPLPAQHRGQPITWSPWKPAPWTSHVDLSCAWCGDPGPVLLAGGRSDGTPTPARFLAERCQHCQEMTVDEQVGNDLRQIAYYKPKAPKGHR